MGKIKTFIKFFIIVGISYLIAITPALTRSVSDQDINNLRSIFRQLDKKADEIDASLAMDEEFLRYKVEYLTALQQFSHPKAAGSPKRKKLFANAAVVLQAEEHSSKESQKTTINLLKQMQSGGGQQDLTLVIEWINQKDQKLLDDYLKGELTAAQLKFRIQFNKNWGFCWDCYLEILDYAKDNNIRVLAAEKLDKAQMSLIQRDQMVADFVAKDFDQTQSRYLIVYGEFHTLGGHLEMELEKRNLPADAKVLPLQMEHYLKYLMQKKNTNGSNFLQLDETTFLMSNSDNILPRKVEYLRYFSRLLNFEPEMENFLSKIEKGIFKRGLEKSECRQLLAEILNGDK